MEPWESFQEKWQCPHKCLKIPFITRKWSSIQLTSILKSNHKIILHHNLGFRLQPKPDIFNPVLGGKSYTGAARSLHERAKMSNVNNSNQNFIASNPNIIKNHSNGAIESAVIYSKKNSVDYGVSKTIQSINKNGSEKSD